MGRDRHFQKKPQQSSVAPQTAALMQKRPFAPVQPEEAVGHPGKGAGFNLDSFSLGDVAAASPRTAPIQRKLAIGQPGDQYEQEADQVAATVVNKLQMKPLSIQREAAPEEEELQMKPLSIQREAAPEEEELQMKLSPLEEVGEAPMNLESEIQGAKGRGQAIDNSVRKPIEEAMGADFSSVTIHTNTQSDVLNRALHSRAFTTGKDVFFRQGEYNPQSRDGQELLAHELTHVVQQSGAQTNQAQIQPALDHSNLVIQQKTQNLTNLDEKYVSSKLIGTSKTEKIRNMIQSYNATKMKDGDYRWQVNLLKDLSDTAKAWLNEHPKEACTTKGTAIKEIKKQADGEWAKVHQQGNQEDYWTFESYEASAKARDKGW